MKRKLTTKTTTTKTLYRVRNWPAYNQALQDRGSLTLWLDEALLKDWRQPKGSGQPGHPVVYADQLISLLGSLRELYHLPLRQSIGFGRSLFKLMGTNIRSPDYTTLSRRLSQLNVPLNRLPGSAKNSHVTLIVDSTGVKVSGEGEWKVRLHGKTKTRVWRKVHLTQDEANWQIVGLSMSDAPATDHQQVEDLLSQLPCATKIDELIGDGAYDYKTVHRAVRARGGRVLAPPRKGAIVHIRDPVWRDRNQTVDLIHLIGQPAWKVSVGYHRRSKAETTMSRYKTTFGDHLATKTDASQLAQLRLRTRILNVFAALGLPDSYKVAVQI